MDVPMIYDRGSRSGFHLSSHFHRRRRFSLADSPPSPFNGPLPHPPPFRMLT